jgi:hypothetical protein
MSSFYNPVVDGIIPEHVSRFFSLPHDGLINGRMYKVIERKDLKYVAKQGEVGYDWAVYASTQDTVSVVAITHWGDKLLQRDGEVMFPEWAEVLTWRK